MPGRSWYAAGTRSPTGKREFAELETKALKIANERGGEALGAGDIALAAAKKPLS